MLALLTGTPEQHSHARNRAGAWSRPFQPLRGEALDGFGHEGAVERPLIRVASGRRREGTKRLGIISKYQPPGAVSRPSSSPIPSSMCEKRRLCSRERLATIRAPALGLSCKATAYSKDRSFQIKSVHFILFRPNFQVTR
jgi:hypothetical protein